MADNRKYSAHEGQFLIVVVDCNFWIAHCDKDSIILIIFSDRLWMGYHVGRVNLKLINAWFESFL